MEDYNFWADLLASYRASPDGVKALWLLVPLAPALGLFMLAVAAAARLVVPRGDGAVVPDRAIIEETPPEDRP